MATIDNMPSETIRLDDENRDELERLYEQKKVVKFDWENRWLKGEEYFYILANMEQYIKQMGIEKFGVKKHPESIYIEPINGLLYFVKGTSIGSEFGFPRLGIKKKYKWKKMNFTTDLPKKDPLVSYIVASAVKWEKFFPGSSKDGPCFRMHAVILKKRKVPVYPGCQVNPKCYSYILWHVRKVKFRKGGNDDDVASNENVDQASGTNPNNDNEESKVSKPGNKRGRPRKNPLVVKDEGSVGKMKRGRKPKKLYDIEQNGSKYGGNMTFNESEHKDNESQQYSSEGNERINHVGSPPLGPIERNLKMMDSHNFSFDSMVNLGKNDNFQQSHLPFYPRKQSLDNPLDKFFNEVPQNLDYIQEQRSRRVSSVLSPYNMPWNPPNIASPSPIRGTSFNNAPDFKNKGYSMSNTNGQQSSEENVAQRKLNELIAQSFKSWQNKPSRKETEDFDFSKQDNPILNILNKGNTSNNDKKLSPYDNPFASILSPDYKPRSFSINSGGWTMPPHSQIQNNKQSGWEYESNNDKAKEESRNGNESRLIKVSTFTRNNDYKAPSGSMRKSTMVDNVNTLKQASPLFFPKFSAAFKPFKKRAHSFHNGSETNMMKSNGNSPDITKRRDEKAARKWEEEQA